MHRLGVVAATVLVVIVAFGASPLVAAPPGVWVRPVDGEVVRPFAAPATPYGPGHRGVDLAAPPGTQVQAAGAGTVSFAGSVAGTLHVVVVHAGGLRTSYSYLRDLAVREGEEVARGQVVGQTGGASADQHGGSLHLGLRRGDTYLDPMQLFEPDDLTELVRLVPTTGEETVAAPWPRAGDAQHLMRDVVAPPDWVLARSVSEAMSNDAGFGDALAGAVAHVAGVSGRAVDWTDAQLTRVGAAALTMTGDLARRLYEWSARNVGPVQALDDVLRIGHRFLDWVEHRRSCEPHAPAADGSGGSRHTLLAVAGINSATGSDGATFSLDTEALGFGGDDVRYFSYAADAGRYDQEDTWVDLFVSAERLGEQLRDMQRVDPGREVDLIAHSQGGIVVDVFLQYVWDPTDPRYPPIGTVVTLASPHRGAPIASALDRVDDTTIGRAVLAGLRASRLGLPLGRSSEQLSEHSELMGDLWERPPYEQLHVTSIGGSDDVVVPADRTDVPGATVVTLDVDGAHDHVEIPTDPGALRAVRAALERRAPPCVSFLDGVRGAVAPVVINRFETTAGDMAGAGAAFVERRLWRFTR